MTLSEDFVRSWLRSRRTVSRLVSTSSLPPATKPATRTRWKGETSILGRIGVSIGISKYEGPHAIAAPMSIAAIPTNVSLLAFRIFRLARAVIDFLEELEVLANLRVVRFEIERFFVRLARFVEP